MKLRMMGGSKDEKCILWVESEWMCDCSVGTRVGVVV